MVVRRGPANQLYHNHESEYVSESFTSAGALFGITKDLEDFNTVYDYDNACLKSSFILRGMNDIFAVEQFLL